MNREQFDCYLDGVGLMLGDTVSRAQLNAIVEKFDQVLDTEIAHAKETAMASIAAPVDNTASIPSVGVVIDATHMSDADFAALNARVDPVIDQPMPQDAVAAA
ncbi:MAG TPA: hypothetical protein VHP34_11660 [Alphaproteobacteria bacterium]|nr:hypothetical protein [Alphaproteobacteria bacterium]